MRVNTTKKDKFKEINSKREYRMGQRENKTYIRSRIDFKSRASSSF